MNQPFGGSIDLVGQVAAPRPVRLVAVVVTHNRQAQLRRTVDRLLQEDLDAILVVDSASTDGSADFLLGIADERLHVVVLSQNVGGAGGFEQGMRVAAERFDADWLVVMDDDARPYPGVMSRFLARAAGFEKAGYEGVAGGVYYPDGMICEMNRPSRNPFWHLSDFVATLAGTLTGRGREGFHIGDDAYAAVAPVPIDATSFVGFFVSRQGLKRAGFPDGKLFIYGDDVIYTLKMTRNGGKIGFVPDLRFEHDCSTYRRGGGDVYLQLWKVYYNYRNSLLAYRVAAGPVLFWPIFVIAAVKWWIRARHAGPDRTPYMRLYRAALKDALLRRLTRTHHQVKVMARHVDPPQDKAHAQRRG